MINNEALLNAILDNISDAIVTIDEHGIIHAVNKTVEAMFGYSESELINHNINIIMPSPYTELHDSYLARYLKTKQKRIIGKSRELEAQRKNGEVFKIELFVHELGLNKEDRFLGIIRDISERKQMEQMKAEFISTVSHELRTPLTSIKGSLGMVNSGVLGELPEKAKRMVTLAHNNTERLILLVNDLLDVEKIQAGKIDLQVVKVNLTELVRDSIEANQSYANNLQVSVILLGSPEDYFVEADNNRLMQVMANLISNAAKYSPKNGQVEITIQADKNFIKVSVIDYGLGIPKEYHAKMFQKFSQVDSSDTRKKGGTGLGLNITKAIVEHHGGQINFESEYQQGSTFFFVLPSWQEPAKPKITSPEPLSAAKKVAGKILVLEDEPDIAKLIALMLEQESFLVTTCSSAEQAKEILLNESFDVMTVDLRLPGQDGLSLIKELRHQEHTQDLPIIIVSAEANNVKNNNITSGLRVIDWIEKPIDQQHLIESISESIKKEGDYASKILYVEDDKDLTQIMTLLLEDKVTVVSANTLQQAKKLLQDETFDLVILDVGLPDGTGLDILPFLNTHLSTTPIIIFSGESITEDVVNRVDAALIKSKVSNNELVGTIKSLINLK
ncbi:MAG: response regulator [Methylococcaceae bacterium]|nr:response regulator [Methylococcaceae bacterium]